MRKSSGKTVRGNELNFYWDKKAQSYMENQDNYKPEKNIILCLEEYFNFLEDIKPAFGNPKENQIEDKQFVL